MDGPADLPTDGRHAGYGRPYRAGHLDGTYRHPEKTLPKIYPVHLGFVLCPCRCPEYWRGHPEYGGCHEPAFSEGAGLSFLYFLYRIVDGHHYKILLSESSCHPEMALPGLIPLSYHSLPRTSQLATYCPCYFYTDHPLR